MKKLPLLTLLSLLTLSLNQAPAFAIKNAQPEVKNQQKIEQSQFIPNEILHQIFQFNTVPASKLHSLSREWVAEFQGVALPSRKRIRESLKDQDGRVVLPPWIEFSENGEKLMIHSINPFEGMPSVEVFDAIRGRKLLDLGLLNCKTIKKKDPIGRKIKVEKLIFGKIYDAKLIDGGERAILLTSKKSLEVWNLNSGKREKVIGKKFIKKHRPVGSITVSSDGEHVAVPCIGKNSLVFNLLSNKLVAQFQPAASVLFLGNGHLVFRKGSYQSGESKYGIFNWGNQQLAERSSVQRLLYRTGIEKLLDVSQTGESFVTKASDFSRSTVTWIRASEFGFETYWFEPFKYLKDRFYEYGSQVGIQEARLSKSGTALFVRSDARGRYIPYIEFYQWNNKLKIQLRDEWVAELQSLSADFSSDGSKVAVLNSKGVLILELGQDFAKAVQFLELPQGSIDPYQVKYSPDGKRIAVLYGNGEVDLWALSF